MGGHGDACIQASLIYEGILFRGPGALFLGVLRMDLGARKVYNIKKKERKGMDYMDGSATESGATTARRNGDGHYPIEARKTYVRWFLASQPISQTAFAAQHGIGPKTFARWLAAYGPALGAGAGTGPSTHGGSSQAVSVPYAEYLELQEIKAKYIAICAMCR